MKLSEAIRAGLESGLVEENRQVRLEPSTKRACALGLAYVGKTGWIRRIDTEDMLELFTTEFPEIEKMVVSPCDNCIGSYLLSNLRSPVYRHSADQWVEMDEKETLLDIVNHLHCIDKWSAAAIAEWVETIENSLETTKDKMEEDKKSTEIKEESYETIGSH